MRRLLLAASFAVLGGCTNLGAVHDISGRLTNASANWNDVGSEISASCERERAINAALSDCDLERKASAGLADANAVLSNYFKALLNAATETNFTIDPGLAAATSSVTKIPGINQSQVDAISGLVGLLANLVTEKVREDTLRDLIGRGTPAARTVVGGLDTLVVDRLGRRLDTEKMQLTSRFGKWIGDQGNNVGADPAAACTGSKASTFKGTGFLLTLEYCRRLAILDRRTKALSDYRASLKTADEALAELQSSKTRLKAADLAQRLYAIGSELDQKIAAVRKAFA